ncbi:MULTISPECIES: DoxX family protein [unclassified Corynebacterium]|uniref:DoxX family protein n=1 Tax=unclassified Corynebacterium TaxID=2624378 RepID=UPI0008A1FEFA|nr:MULTISPECIES: DoxX family protein [unclassified Corynebacterium]OFN75809.1 DoxX family protein [Corynebacterium sp. HMSC074E01]OFO94969.1 DoxX family protein [Corynebacterium sp. HMSC034H07]
MSDKTPDKATDFDDDIPTYTGKDSVKDSTPEAEAVEAADKPKKSSLFQRPGRAEPQVIKPKKAEEPAVEAEPEAKTETFESATRESLSFDSAAAETETTAFPRAEAMAESDAQTTAMPVSATATESAATETYEEVPSTVAVADPAVDSEVAAVEEKPEPARRGTIDFGLLFVRLALSVYLLVAGASTFFKLGGNEGLSGLENEFGEYTMAAALAIGVPTVQLIAGAFLLLGLVTPLAAMFGLIVTGFSAIHGLNASGAGLDVFAWNESVWLGLVLFVIAVALQFTGPGFISLDFNRSWTRRPLATSWIFVVIGVAALVAIWWFGAGVNPLN